MGIGFSGWKIPSAGWLLIGVLILSLWGASLSFAEAGFSPSSYQNSLTYGEGVFLAPPHLVVYEAPDPSSQVLETLDWSDTSLSVTSQKTHQNIPPQQPFLAFYPAQKVALMAVVSENGEGWAEVIYHQPTQKHGWVQLEETTPQPSLAVGQFLPWLALMKQSVLKNGFYWLSGVSEYQRSLRTQPEDTAHLISLQAPRGFKVRHIRGNWMLVEALDFDRQTPIGWVRWRSDDGRLMVFANFFKQQTTASSFIP